MNQMLPQGIFWDIFEHTGNIDVYLCYRKGETHFDQDERCAADHELQCQSTGAQGREFIGER